MPNNKEFWKSPWLAVDFNASTRKAVISIDGIIGCPPRWDGAPEDSAQTKEIMKKELKKFAELKASEIEVNINSPGGSVAHGLSIHDLLKSSKAKITTNVYGMSASAATVIAQAGDVRRVSENALYLIHRCWDIHLGNARELEEAVENQRKIDSTLARLYARRSGKTETEIFELMDENNGNGKWLNGDEVVEYGLCDEIFEPENVSLAAAAAVDIKKISSALNLPPLPETLAIKPPKPQKTEQANGKNSTKEKKNMPVDTEKIKDFKTCFGAEAALNYLGEDKSFEDAARDYIPQLNKKNEDLSSEVETLTAENSTLSAKVDELQAKLDSIEDGADPLPVRADAGTGLDEEPVKKSAVERWNEATAAYRKKHECNLAEASIAVAKADPELHAAYRDETEKKGK